MVLFQTPFIMKYRIAVLFCILLFSISLLAQTTVSGTVTDNGGIALPGVNIIEQNTTNGTTTDFDGNYTIEVADDATLVISFVGFASQTIAVNGRTTLNIQLQEDAAALDEVVVVGFGSQRKRDLTGAISQIKSKDIVQVVTANPTTALQGKLAGVQVESNGGAPGSPANVFVRGVSSLTNSFPLYVVDGTIVDDITLINPKDIVDIQVLKDATSAAIYGSRAANGVIIVTTDHGKTEMAPQVSIDIRGGLNTQSKTLDLLNGPEYIDFLNQRLENDGRPRSIVDPGIDTDFQDLTINSGTIQDYGFNITGGGENASYFFSSNYYKEEGLLISSDFERVNTRLNAKFDFGKFQFRPSISLAQNRFTENLAFGRQGFTVPIIRASNPDNEGGFEAIPNGFGIGGGNKYAQALLVDDDNTLRNVIVNLNTTYTIFEGLSATLNLGLDYRNRYNNTFQPTFFLSNVDPQFNENEFNDLTEVRGEILSTNVEPTLNYKKSFGNHNINALIGGARQEVDDNTLAVYAEGLLTNDITNIASFSDNIVNSGGGRFLSRLFSYFGRLNYNFAEKYYFTVITRRDQSSKFLSVDNRNENTATSFSAAWVPSEENFWPADGFINTLKIRGGLGVLASQNIDSFLFSSTFSPNSDGSFGGIRLPGFSQKTIGNPLLAFETSQTFNVGADISMLNGDITASIDYFSRDNEDVLLPVTIPVSTGFNTQQIQNAAAINNQGIEFEATYNYRSENDFNFSVGVNVAAIRNELIEARSPITGPGINEENITVNRFEEGEPLGFFFGFETDGIYNSQAEIESDPNTQNDPERRAILQPGDLKRVDTNGDGQIDETDRVNLGDPTPDFTYGLNFNGNYKNLDFALFFNGQQGNEIYNVQKFFGFYFADDNKLGIVRDAFTPNNPDTDIPRVTQTDPAGNQQPSDFFVENGSFFRLKTLEVGYDLSDTFNVKWVSKTRVFFNVQNVFTITKYSGYDPEIGSAPRANLDTGFFGFNPALNPILGRGLDITAQPRPRTFVLGIQMTF